MRRRAHWLLLAIFFLLTLPLWERSFEFIIEPDFWSPDITAWRQFFGSWKSEELPPPTGTPYLDGEYISYAIAANFFQAIAQLLPGFARFFPNQDSYNVAGAFLCNSISYAVGCWIFYHLVARLTGRDWLAAACAGVVAISPPMMAINFLRMDFLTFGPLMATYFLSALYACGDFRRRTAVGLGVALGLLAVMKLNGGAFVVMPILAVAARWAGRARPVLDWRFIAYAGCTAAVIAFTLLFRYWMHYAPFNAIQHLIDAALELRSWQAVFHEPPSYYLSKLFLGHGAVFVATYLACAVYVLVRAGLKRETAYVYVALALLAFTALGLWGLRYERGGYHLLPLYVLSVAFAVNDLLSIRGRWARFAIGGAVALAGSIALTLALSTAFYAERVEAASLRAGSVEALRRAPAAWLRAHVREGDTICILRGEEWAVPPLDVYDANVGYGPFDFPYRDPPAMANFGPPTLQTVQTSCSVLLVTDFHLSFYATMLRDTSADNSQRWDSFFVDLNRSYPPVKFQAETPLSGVAAIQAYDLRGTP